MEKWRETFSNFIDWDSPRFFLRRDCVNDVSKFISELLEKKDKEIAELKQQLKDERVKVLDEVEKELERIVVNKKLDFYYLGMRDGKERVKQILNTVKNREG